MTPEASLMVRVADALAASGIAYLLAGSFSSNYYGIPPFEVADVSKRGKVIGK